MREFNTYFEAFNYACEQASFLGITQGVGHCKFNKKWTVQNVPKNPDGTESRLQHVLPGEPKLTRYMKE